MDPHDDYARELRDLVLEAGQIEEFLDDLVGVAARTIDGEVGVGLTMARSGYPTTVANSDTRAAQCDEIQYDFQDGPCLTAMRLNEPVFVDDLAQDERWGPYRSHALAMGTQSSMSLPVHGGGDVRGAFNVYSAQPHAFGRAERTRGQQFADEVTRALSLVVQMTGLVQETAQLQQAIVSRTVIDQAIGILMAQNRIGATAAFAILRKASMNRNDKLRVVAGDVVRAVGGS